MTGIEDPKVEDHPPPAYDGFGQGSSNAASQAQALSGLALPAPIEASSFPPRPSPLRPVAALPIPLESLQTSSLRGWRRQAHAGGTQLGNPFVDPERSASEASASAPGSRERNRGLFVLLFVLLLHVPFLIISIMDIVGTYIMPKSGFYRSVVHSRSFELPFICVGLIMAVVNTALLYNCLYTSCLGGASKRTRSLGAQRWMRVGYSLLFFFATIGIGCWPIIETLGVHKHIKPMPRSCEEQGFSSSILLQVVGGKTNRFTKLWATNNATIEFGGEAFGLTLSPAIRPGRGYDTFSFTPSVALTTPGLFPSFSGDEVTIRLSEKSYGFQYTVPKVPGTLFVRNGTFNDDRGYYLSFPTMSPPLHSTMKGNWTYVDSRPWVELVDDERTVLKTVQNRPRDMPNTMMRMCGAWSLNDMVEDEQKMEMVLVGLARMMIELAIWGLDY